MTLRVTIQPLIVWLWIGGGVMALGTLLCVVPGRRRSADPSGESDSLLSEVSEPQLPSGQAGGPSPMATASVGAGEDEGEVGP